MHRTNADANEICFFILWQVEMLSAILYGEIRQNTQLQEPGLCSLPYTQYYLPARSLAA